MSPNLPPATRLKVGPLIVEIFGRRYPDVDCPYNGNWLISEASLSERSWTCPAADIDAAELVEFHDHLDAYARGASDEVSYFPSVQVYTINLTRTPDGSSGVRISYGDDAQITVRLSQSDVGQLLRELSQTLEIFPNLRKV